MQRICYLLLGLVALLSLNCQKEISDTINPFGNPVTATVQGNVFDENDNPAAGVTITIGTKTATTDARGYFRIRNASLDKKTSLLTAVKSGYFKAIKLFGASKAVNQVEIKLLPKTLSGSFNSSTGGEILLGNGSKVKFTANSLVTASGNTYSGTVNVFATYIDPTSPDIIRTMPGSFLALSSNNENVLLQSFAMMAVELESPSGEKLQIAGNSTATLSFNIPSGLQTNAPASMPLWWLDEKTGLWKEEGSVTKNGNIYEGDVRHFTYWNCDVAGPTVNMSATFVDQDGNPLQYASITVRPLSGYNSAHGCTDSLGQIINKPIPKNIPLVLEVQTGCYNVIYSQNIGPFSSDVNLGTITVNNQQSMLTIEGRLLNCSAAPVTNGFAIINYDNGTRYVSVNSSGHFSSSIIVCGNIPATCSITGVDNTASQQSMPGSFNITTPVTNVGDITACGTSSVEFIDYTLDGSNTNLSSSNAGDTFMSIDSSAQGSHTVMIRGSRNQQNNIQFDFDSNGNPGTWPMSYIFVGGINTTANSGSIVTVTRHAVAVGDFFEGSFSGQFRDPQNNLHIITGTFRVRKDY